MVGQLDGWTGRDFDPRRRQGLAQSDEQSARVRTNGGVVGVKESLGVSLLGGVHANDGMTFMNHAIPSGANIPVGADFYVGLIDIQTGLDEIIRFPASLDTDSGTQGRSWAWFGGADLAEPGAGDHTIGTIDSFGLPGNWLIRATGVPAPGALALLGLAGLAARRRRRA
ncbi:MAG: PEP-CTERM sorting domain-containing protein [Planctomycetes bacterium]|nr:PEP-CTERM sorting domain-containing protein [Planctomycetota bacterium]